ncbi:MAG: hypothetical protein E7646_07525 [Ruminococcaceae bacterium]|nr:hypothetical protein [Oscillospiraceae bacterium]
MKKTLSELCAAVGCSKYPQRWESIYQSSMDDFDKNGCLYCKEEFYDEMKAKYDCFGEFFELYKECAKNTAKDEDLARFLKLLCDALGDDENRHSDLKEFSRPKCPEGKDLLTYDMCTGLALCSLLDKGAANIRKRGFDQKTVSETLYLAVGAVKSFMRTHEGRKGFDLLNWCMLYINGELFLIDRLEIQFNATFGARAMVFENKEGTLIALAHQLMLHRDGFALGSAGFTDEEGSYEANVEETEDYYVGQPIDEYGYVLREKILLDKKQWTLKMKKGDKAVSIHIPPSSKNGPLTPEAVDTTLEHTRQVLKKAFDDVDHKGFFCHSWLMDPKLCDLLGEDSNISKFNMRYTKIPCVSKGTAVFNFIFNQTNPDEVDIKALPENTKLERALKKHYLDGNVIYEMYGVFF